jgi:hypothetical protein
MVAEPDAVDRAVADQLRGHDPGPRLRMCVRGSDEHMVDPPAVSRLPDHLVDLGSGGRGCPPTR